MKKLYAVALAIMLLLCGCGDSGMATHTPEVTPPVIEAPTSAEPTDAPPTVTPTPTPTWKPTSRPIPTFSPMVVAKPLPTPIAETRNLLDGVATFIQMGEYATLPLSYLIDGEQQLVGDMGWYSFVGELYPELYDFAILPRVNNPSHGYDILSNGDWDFFPTVLIYEEYEPDIQPDNMEWDELFNAVLGAVSETTPLVYTDAWIFDWNGRIFDKMSDIYLCRFI